MFFFWFHEVKHCLCRHFTHICKIWDYDLTYYRTWKVFRHFLTVTRKKTFRRIFSYPIGCEKKALSDILASSLSWKNSKHVKAGVKLKLKFKSARFYSWLRIFRDTSLSIHVFVNKNCCHFKCFIELYFLPWMLSRSLTYHFASCCFQSYMNIACRSTQNATCI